MRKSFIVMMVMMVMMVIAIAQLAAASSPMDSHQKQVAYMAIADVAILQATMTEAKVNSNMPFIAGAPAREFGRYSGARPDYKYLSVSADDFKAVMSFTVKPSIEGLGRYSGDKPHNLSLTMNTDATKPLQPAGNVWFSVSMQDTFDRPVGEHHPIMGSFNYVNHTVAVMPNLGMEKLPCMGFSGPWSTARC